MYRSRSLDVQPPRATLRRRRTLPLPAWQLVPLPGCTLTPAGRRKLSHLFFCAVLCSPSPPQLLAQTSRLPPGFSPRQNSQTVFFLRWSSPIRFFTWFGQNRGFSFFPTPSPSSQISAPAPSCFTALLPFNPHGGPSPSSCSCWLLTVLRLRV